MFPIYKKEDNSALWTTYEVKLGARRYTSPKDTNPTNLSESTISEMVLEEPVYESTWDEYEELDYNKVETKTKQVDAIKSSKTYEETFDSDRVKGWIESSVKVDLEVNKDATIPDALKFKFYASAPSSQFYDQAPVEFYYTFKSGSDYHTVTCTSTIGDYDTRVVKEYKGSEPFKNANIGTATVEATDLAVKETH